jgi:hypothetical protein
MTDMDPINDERVFSSSGDNRLSQKASRCCPRAGLWSGHSLGGQLPGAEPGLRVRYLWPTRMAIQALR